MNDRVESALKQGYFRASDEKGEAMDAEAFIAGWNALAEWQTDRRGFSDSPAPPILALLFAMLAISIGILSFAVDLNINRVIVVVVIGIPVAIWDARRFLRKSKVAQEAYAKKWG